MTAGKVLALVNKFGHSLESIGLRPGEWRASELLATELGEDPPELQLGPALDRLARACREEAALTTVGRIAVHRHVIELLRNLARMRRARTDTGGIGTEPVDEPVFITGLPRTGSTLLHALMAQDPANRVPVSHEVMRPPTAPGEEVVNRRYCERRLRWADRLVPDFKAIHPIGAHLPEECIAITAYTFRSIVFHTTENVPAYQDWFEQTDQRIAYRFHRWFLQYLRHFGARGRWVLKAPGHMFGIRALADVYPDAAIVQTHRDPVRVAASLASHTTVLRAAFSDRIDPEAIAGDWLERWWRALDSLLEFRAADVRPVIDVYYLELMRDPIGSIETLYSQLGWDLSAEARENMTRYLSASAKGAHTRHRYALENFGLDADSVRRRLEGYLSQFAIQDELP